MKENKSNGLDSIISQAIEEMKAEQGNIFFSGTDQPCRAGAANRDLPGKTQTAQREWVCKALQTQASVYQRKSGAAGSFKSRSDL